MNKFTKDNMTIVIKSELNAVAGTLALFEGYQTPEDRDFLKHANKSPRDRKYWNMAVAAWSCIKHDDEALGFQVK